jgi:hypothetical protein
MVENKWTPYGGHQNFCGMKATKIGAANHRLNWALVKLLVSFGGDF